MTVDLKLDMTDLFEGDEELKEDLRNRIRYLLVDAVEKKFKKSPVVDAFTSEVARKLTKQLPKERV